MFTLRLISWLKESEIEQDYIGYKLNV